MGVSTQSTGRRRTSPLVYSVRGRGSTGVGTGRGRGRSSSRRWTRNQRKSGVSFDVVLNSKQKKKNTHTHTQRKNTSFSFKEKQQQIVRTGGVYDCEEGGFFLIYIYIDRKNDE